jgi:hypothetical protein
LPTSAAASTRRYFTAHLSGMTAYYPFDPALDTLKIAALIGSMPTGDIFGWLVKSNFTPREWMVCGSALHCKSKTFTYTAR